MISARALPALKRLLEEGRALVRARFDSGADGAMAGVAAAGALSGLVDAIVQRLFALAAERAFPVASPTTGERMAVIAIGGYGRGELAPFSDIDLLVLLPYKRTPRAEQVVEFVLYRLWDLGLKVGHAVRSLDECIRLAKADMMIRTTLLETRLLAGDPGLYAELARRFRRDVVGSDNAAFVAEKLAERERRHAKWGDSRYLLEPNVKDGKGALRDLQALAWIARHLHNTADLDELVELNLLSRPSALRFARAHRFLWTVRCHLHWIAGRAEERLTFDVQTEIAGRLGYTDHTGSRRVERFMRHYFLVVREVGRITGNVFAAVEGDLASSLWRWRRRARVDGFLVENGRLAAEPEQFAQAPIDLIRIFRVAQKHGYELHPSAARQIEGRLRLVDPLREDKAANALFLELLTEGDPRAGLHRMNEASVLGRFVPDWGRIVALSQQDMYHVYTVDEHTLRALGRLWAIEQGKARDELPLQTALAGKPASRRALYVAVMMHDICKGRGGDHSVLGEAATEALGPRLGLDAEEVETAAWLVRWHLAMSDTAFKRDLDDPRTVADFAARVQSPERLRLLLLLTTADISAVGPGRWSAWKAGLLADLYHRTADHLAGAPSTRRSGSRIAQAKEAARAALADFTEAEVEAFLKLGQPGYWLAYDTGSHARHARLLRAAEQSGQDLTIALRRDEERGAAEVTIATQDHPGLFAQLAGAIALSGLSIVDARISTMTNGVALDVFSVVDTSGPGADPLDRRERLVTTVKRALAGQLRPDRELARRAALPSRTQAIPAPPRVLIDNKASATQTVVEVNGRDRPGLLHDLTLALSRLNMTIGAAKIATYGHRVVDVFYVKDIFGLKLDDDDKLAQLRQALMAVMERGEARAA